jgi:MoaA/NifB/PqqE/SkfB family radical SAM enzyme
MHYEIEADWHLLNTCNYRCSYCFFPPDFLGEKLQTHASPQQWQSAFDATGYTWLLHMTGGEPGVYPSFAELSEALTRRHFISINSNLSRPFQSFAERVDPTRVSFINAGFHFEERERRSDHAAFLANAELLRSKGFPLLVSIVATPSALERFQEASDILAQIGVVPIPKVLRGSYMGRLFPEAYTDLDRTRFRTFAELARRFYQPLLFNALERPSIDMFRDDDLLHGEPSFAGQSCEAGPRFVRIDPMGEVVRCSGPTVYGNILAGTFKRARGPKPCNTRACVYFCLKYAKPAAPRTRGFVPGFLTRFSNFISDAGKPN